MLIYKWFWFAKGSRKKNGVPQSYLIRLQRWSFFHNDGMVMKFFWGFHCYQRFFNGFATTELLPLNVFFHWLTIDINGFFNGFPQVLVRARIWCELKKGVFFGNFSQIQKLSRLPGNFPDCPETFQTVQKLSRLSKNFPDSPETFQTHAVF